jgi:surface protein
MKKILPLVAFMLICTQSLYAQMMLQYQTTTANTSITLPLLGTVNATINWGDFSQSGAFFSGNQTHTYANPGNYIVIISGTVTHFGANFLNIDNPCLKAVLSWDNVGLTSLNYAFCNASSLTSVPSSLPATVTDLSSMFFYATSFNSPIGNWNTTNVTDMNNMFYEATSFNQPINSWNTANVTNMTSMFFHAESFNQPISAWNTVNVISMTDMFEGAIIFNQSIGSWNTTNVTSMYEMFNGAWAFNQPIATWNTANVTNMGLMFLNAGAFNQPISTWNTAKVTSMEWMFNGAWAFNQPIAAWNTANVTDMNSMFMSARAFNQPIGSWNTANVTNMNAMFAYTNVFNQPIGLWNTANVTNMSSMFENAKAFNQPIGSWNINKVTDMGYMFTGDTLCTVNYDNLLNGWSSKMPQSGVNFDGGYSQYSSASSTARKNLINNNSWTITDGSLNPDNTQCHSNITTGVQTSASNAIGLYPNPSTGQVTISSNDALENIIICNSVGTIVYQTNTNSIQQNIDFSNNEPGLYLVKIGNQTIKLVKE